MTMLLVPPSFPTQDMRVTPTTWNPSDKDASATLSNGNLTVTTAQSGRGFTRSIFSASAGKWYWEISLVSSNTSHVFAPSIALSTASLTITPGNDANSWAYFASNGNKTTNNTQFAYGETMAAGDLVSVLLDMDAGSVEFWKNGVSQGVAFTGLSGAMFAAIGDTSNSNGGVSTANFGASPFTYTPPNGYFRGFGAPK
jgi:hypothetical protein